MALGNQHNHLNIQDGLNAINQKIAVSLFDLNLDPAYRGLLENALSTKSSQAGDSDQTTKPWGLLPGLCCQAAGGQVSWAETIATSWLLFYAAADLMDSIQDRDDPASWWVEGGPAVALSASTGLFFWASSLLSETTVNKRTASIAADLIKDFHHSFLRMSAGQYADLVKTQPGLDQYWQTASAKSGSFFALACRSGARIATRDMNRISAFGEFGHALGILIQILDDLEDMQMLRDSSKVTNFDQISRSLPMVYALQVLPSHFRDQLIQTLRIAEKDPGVGQNVFDLIEQSGSVIYLLAEIEHYKSEALEKLSMAAEIGKAQDILRNLVRQLGSLE